MSQEYGLEEFTSGLTEDVAVVLISAIAEAKGLPIRILTRARVMELCADTLGGVEQDYWDQLIDLTMAKLNEADELNPDDSDSMIEVMQDVVADRKFPTIW